MKKIILTLFLFCIVYPLTYADILLQTNTNTPALNEPFVIQVKFLNESKKDYNIEGINNFQIISRSSQSSYSIINGQKNSAKTDIFQLIPLKKGTVNLQVIGDNGKVSSNKLSLNIESDNTSVNTNVNNEITVDTNIKNKSSYYFGEKIPFYEKFLSTIRLNSLGYVTPPEFKGFSAKDITPVDNNGQYMQNYFVDKNGNNGIEITLFEAILTADSSGKKNINLGKIGYTQASQDDFFFSRGVTKYIGGNSIDIDILPLPQDQPVGFQNVVGTPKITYNWNKNKINYGDSVVLDISINGSVNLDTLEQLLTTKHNNFNVFESVKEFKENINNGKYYAEKKFEIAFIPKTNGTIKTPEISIPYFNTETKKFENLIVPSHEITVEGNVSSTSIINNNQSQTTTDMNSSPQNPEEITINSISSTVISKDNNHLIIGLIAIIVIEGLIIASLLVKRTKKDSKFDFSEMQQAKSNKEFYDAYCNFMKKNFKFSPKVHLDDKLIQLGLGEPFIEINQKIEDAYYNNSNIEKKQILKDIKKELKKFD